MERRPAPVEAVAPAGVEAPVETAAAAAADPGELESAAAASWRVAALAPGAGVERGVEVVQQAAGVAVVPAHLGFLRLAGRRPTCRLLSQWRKQHLLLRRCYHFLRRRRHPLRLLLRRERGLF